jgi:hypothetical protein
VGDKHQADETPSGPRSSPWRSRHEDRWYMLPKDDAHTDVKVRASAKRSRPQGPESGSSSRPVGELAV